MQKWAFCRAGYYKCRNNECREKTVSMSFIYRQNYLGRLLGRFSPDRAVWHIVRNKISKTGIWFVDIPRTSSTSTRRELRQQFGWPYGMLGWPQGRNFITYRSNFWEGYFLPFVARHTTARHMRMYLGHQLWQEIFTFSVVRNPWSRYLSSFLTAYHSISPVPYTPDEMRPLFKHWLTQIFSEKPSSIKPVKEYLLDEDGNMIVDFVAKYENRQEDFVYIGEKINDSEFGKRQHLVKFTPEKYHYSEYYDSELRDLVAKVARWEIEKFNYSFEEEPADESHIKPYMA